MPFLTDTARDTRGTIVISIVVLVGGVLTLLAIDWFVGAPARRLRRAFLAIVAEFHPATVSGYLLNSLLERRLGIRPSPRAFDQAAGSLIDRDDVRWRPYGEDSTHRYEGEYLLGDRVLQRRSRAAAQQSV